jgi:hypothetical protein
MSFHITDEDELAELAADYEVTDDQEASIVLDAAIFGIDGDPVIAGGCEIAVDLLADGDGQIDGYRVIIHPTTDTEDPWIASSILRASDYDNDPAAIIRDVVKIANDMLAWSER